MSRSGISQNGHHERPHTTDELLEILTNMVHGIITSITSIGDFVSTEFLSGTRLKTGPRKGRWNIQELILDLLDLTWTFSTSALNGVAHFRRGSFRDEGNCRLKGARLAGTFGTTLCRFTRESMAA